MSWAEDLELKRELEEEEELSPTAREEKEENASVLKRGDDERPKADEKCDEELSRLSPRDDNRSRSSPPLSLSDPGAPLMGIPVSPMKPPVRVAMCASISFLAVSTESGSPVTSKMGSLSREGVMM